jgi:hypothetical protein
MISLSLILDLQLVYMIHMPDYLQADSHRHTNALFNCFVGASRFAPQRVLKLMADKQPYEAQPEDDLESFFKVAYARMFPQFTESLQKI